MSELGVPVTDYTDTADSKAETPKTAKVFFSQEQVF
jgi:hypothetical protein